MTRIQSSVGLVSGIPIEETVNKLIAVAARPRDTLTARNRLLEAESVAIDQLASLVLGLQFDANKLKLASLYTARTASSSNTTALTAAVAAGGSPNPGTYLFTPVQTATSQQLLSQSLETDAVVGAGSFTFRTGGFVDKGISLDALNGGTGVQRGQIRITDRSGANAVIDLRFARSVDDVVSAINTNTTINVTAEAVGDTFRITDNTGQTTSNLIVQEVSGGTTAASLGLSGINVAANSATGSDVFTLHSGTKLTFLNDGNGVQLRSGNDLQVTLADESTLDIDLGSAATLGDVLTAINAADPAKLSATIAADGNRLELTDLTVGVGAFAVSNVGVGTAADDLGLTATAGGDTLTGNRVAGGLRDVLVSSLRGGQGLGTLGLVDITNRGDVSFSVDLSGAETLSEIVAAFNAQSTDVTAAINASRSGIVLTDVSGATVVNFTVADGDANNTATALGIVTDSTATTVNSGTLGRQIVSESTLLSSLNQGAGVTLGSLRITGSNGAVTIVNLGTTGVNATTVGDVINAINAATSVGVTARINDAGDGILLIDTAAGSGTLTVAEVGKGRIAADLKLLGTAVEVDLGGTPTFVIDGTTTSKVTIGAEDKLTDVVKKINDLKAGVTASVVNDGTGQRLSIAVNKTGAANELLLDTTDSSLALQQVSAARDGLLLYGSADTGTGILVSSASNTFSNIVSGLNLTVKEGTKEPVTVTVASTTATLTKSLQDFVAAFNSLRANINKVTEFNEEAQTTGILFGSSAVLRVETDVNRLLSGRFFGVGKFQTLASLGITFDDKGNLSFNSETFAAAYADDPAAVQQFFSDKDLGLAKKLDDIVNRLAVDENSALGTRGAALARKIELNDERIDALNEQLERQRERLLAQFYNLESVIASFERNISAISGIEFIPPIFRQSS